MGKHLISQRGEKNLFLSGYFIIPYLPNYNTARIVISQEEHKLGVFLTLLSLDFRAELGLEK